MGRRTSSRKPTEQELKDRLWAMVKRIDFSQQSLSDIENNDEDYNAWDRDMATLPVKTVKVGGFEASTVDIGKMLEEVEDSCLTDKCKKTLTDALKKAK